MLKYYIIFGYLALIMMVGLLFSKQKDTKNFFVAGKSMHWFPVAISYVASLVSAISFMALPLWTWEHGMLPAFNEIFVVLFALPIIVFIFLPLYGRIGLISIYEFLEHRFSLLIRIAGSFLFLLSRFLWLGMVIYIPSKTLGYITGMQTWHLILIIGFLATIYTCVGGMKAVIWTDVVQFVILFSGVLLVLATVCGRFEGGLSEVVQQGIALDKIKFFRWSWSWETPNTWILLFGAIYSFQNFASDQVVMQRFLSTKSIKSSIVSFVAACGINLVLVFLMYLVGAFLFVYYVKFPDQIQGIELDYIYPRFIVNELPELFGALLIAAILAASMSSVDSGLNSITAVLINDYFIRFSPKKHSEGRLLQLSRWLTVVIGLIVTAVGFLIPRIGTNFIDIVLYTAGWFAPPLAAIFLLGAVSRRTNWHGALVTLVVVPIVMISLWHLKVLPSWIFGVLSMTGSLFIGYFTSLFFKAPDEEKLKYVWQPAYRKLALVKRNAIDDGRVFGDHNLGDETSEEI